MTGGQLREVDTGREDHDTAGDVIISDRDQGSAEHQPPVRQCAWTLLRRHCHLGRRAEQPHHRMVIHGMAAQSGRNPETGSDNCDTQYTRADSM